MSVDRNMTMESSLWNLIHDATEKQFSEFLFKKKHLIEEIIERELTDELVTSWIEDYFEYNADIQEVVQGIMAPIIKNKVIKLLEEKVLK